MYLCETVRVCRCASMRVIACLVVCSVVSVRVGVFVFVSLFVCLLGIVWLVVE